MYDMYLVSPQRMIPACIIGTILILIIYNGIMLFIAKKKDVRLHERYSVNLPIFIEYGENQYTGRVENISEGGLAMYVQKPIYLPAEDNDAKYQINDEEEKISFRGTIGHVDENEEGWNYSIKVKFEHEMEKLKYKKLVRKIQDAENSLWGKSFSVKVTRNLIASSKRKFTSKRRIARLNVNEICELSDGTVLILDNYNFEYVRVSLVKGILTQNIVLFPTKSYAMHCTQCPWNPYLFSVDNQKELSENKEFQQIVDNWSQKDDNIH